jgi:L-ribulokinase
MGTSTCDMLVAPEQETNGKLIRGICGQVPGSIIPGMTGLEAGQSAFGDVYAWFANLLSWRPAGTTADHSAKTNLISALSDEASRLPFEENDELAVDWLNGRRTPDADQLLKAAIIHLNLASDAPRIFKSLVEATCFGAKAIVDRFINEGIPVKGLIGLGGVAKKSNYIMQVMADVMDMPIRIHRASQTCAAGSAMFAATAAGIYKKVEDAMAVMGQGFESTIVPHRDRVGLYRDRYEKYKDLCNYMERVAGNI